LGVKVKKINDDIMIYGNPKLELSNNFEMKNFSKDHRIFFLSCITALALGGRWKINDRDSINTSFPNFLKILKDIGANIK
jgi:5-enolpyruvylshikimate-3-phosphate synthase